MGQSHTYICKYYVDMWIRGEHEVSIL